MYMYGILVQCTGPFGIKESKGLSSSYTPVNKIWIIQQGEREEEEPFREAFTLLSLKFPPEAEGRKVEAGILLVLVLLRARWKREQKSLFQKRRKEKRNHLLLRLFSPFSLLKPFSHPPQDKQTRAGKSAASPPTSKSSLSSSFFHFRTHSPTQLEEEGEAREETDGWTDGVNKCGIRQK